MCSKKLTVIKKENNFPVTIMKKFLLPLLFSLGTSQFTRAQVTLDSTNLPIVAIYTYLTPIPDTPKIHSFMGIIDNGYNVMNHVTDTNFAYYGHIGIEQRGSISQFWW